MIPEMLYNLMTRYRHQKEPSVGCIAVSKLELLMYVFLRRNEPFVSYEDINRFERTFTQNVIEHVAQSPKYQCIYVYP